MILPKSEICPDCGSVETELRRRVFSNATIHFALQCVKCTKVRSEWIPHHSINDQAAVPEWRYSSEGAFLFQHEMNTYE